MKQALGLLCLTKCDKAVRTARHYLPDEMGGTWSICTMKWAGCGAPADFAPLSSIRSDAHACLAGGPTLFSIRRTPHDAHACLSGFITGFIAGFLAVARERLPVARERLPVARERVPAARAVSGSGRVASPGLAGWPPSPSDSQVVPHAMPLRILLRAHLRRAVGAQ